MQPGMTVLLIQQILGGGSACTGWILYCYISATQWYALRTCMLFGGGRLTAPSHISLLDFCDDTILV